MRILVAALVLFANLSTLEAAVPAYIHYQGYLTDVDGTPVTGDYTIGFKFFAQQSGGTAVFTETRDVKMDLGVFAAILGSKPDNALGPQVFAAAELWLELSVGPKGGTLVTLAPRQRVVSHPFSIRSLEAEQCKVADNALSFGGVAPQAYVTLAALPELCITADGLAAKLTALGVQPYGDANVAAYLQANGYKPGGLSSVSWTAIEGKPAGLLTEAAAVDSGIFLLADGSVAASGSIDFAGNEVLNFVVENAASDKAPADPQAGQLWYDTTENVLKVYGKAGWTGLASGAALDCEGCVDEGDVSFPYAAAATKGGAAANSTNLQCTGCVEAAELSVNWAMGVSAGGAAANLQCVGCVTLGALEGTVLAAGNVKYDDTATLLGATTVAGAVTKLDSRVDLIEKNGSGNFNEGNGTVVALEDHWNINPLSEVSQYIHVLGAKKPKVMAFLYGNKSVEGMSAGNVQVSSAFPINVYSAGVNGTAGQDYFTSGEPAALFVGANILLHQTVGTDGNGTNAGKWELAVVKKIEGTKITLSKPLTNTYTDQGPTGAQSQAVVAATFTRLEALPGSDIKPSKALDDNAESGGILYIRAQQVIVRNGGIIEADGYGYQAADSGFTMVGDSHCKAQPGSALTAVCSGGGGANNTGYGGGGGGNKTAGSNGSGAGSGGGYGGAVAPTFTGSQLLMMGGAGGVANYSGSSGSGTQSSGGGVVVIGAQSILVEASGRISANGSPTSSGRNGAGAGGMIALFADTYDNKGSILQVNGGAIGPTGGGGAGGVGFTSTEPSKPGMSADNIPKGIEIYIDGTNVTSTLGDPNSKGAPNYDSTDKKWGVDGVTAWSSGMLDLSSLNNWGPGEHKITLKETGGNGGELKLYSYLVQNFTVSKPPENDTCDTAKTIDPMLAPAVVMGTTEDVMGGTRAIDDYVQPLCGGSGGADVVYRIPLTEWRKLDISVVAPFPVRTYLRKGDCKAGVAVGCGTDKLTTDVLKTGDYYLFIDSDGNMSKGDFKLVVTAIVPPAPANDTCAAPVELIFDGTGKAEVYGYNLFSNDDYKSKDCGQVGGRDNVYMMNIPSSIKELKVSLDSAFNPVFFIGNNPCATCNTYPVCVPSTNNFTFSYPASGVWYLILDGMTEADKGEYTLTVQLTKI